MLSYAFQVLNTSNFQKIQGEEFDNLGDLYAEILILGINKLLKHGLNQEYINKEESLSVVRGKIDVSKSVKNQTFLQKKLVCSFNEYSTNSYFNQILKSCVVQLLKTDIQKERKIKLRKLMIYFSNVDVIDIKYINWHFRFNRNNQIYSLLLSICNFIVKGLLLSKNNGLRKIIHYTESQMHRLYEKFILEYYKKEFAGLKVSSSQIDWVLDDDNRFQLPNMQSDIMISKDNTVLIIDAKYYQNNMQSQHNHITIHSHNLYQIFTYVKNKELSIKEKHRKVSGMLLYAKTDSQIQPNNTYLMSGNKISVRTLDLNCDFNAIKTQLNTIIDEYFPNN